jgi:hypothetical protein
VTLLSEEPELRSTSEALVRLDAVGTGAIGGADIGPDTELLIGFRDCEATDRRHGYHFSGRTHCVATGDGSVVPLRVPKVIREAVDGVELVVRLSRADGTEPDSQPERLVLFFGDDEVARLEVDDGWVEHHVILPPTSATREEVALRIEAPFPVRFDHALLVPRSTRLASSALH